MVTSSLKFTENLCHRAKSYFNETNLFLWRLTTTTFCKVCRDRHSRTTNLIAQSKSLLLWEFTLQEVYLFHKISRHLINFQVLKTKDRFHFFNL